MVWLAPDRLVLLAIRLPRHGADVLCPASMIDPKSCSALSRLLVEQLLASTEVAEGTRKAAEASYLLEAASPPRLPTRRAAAVRRSRAGPP